MTENDNYTATDNADQAIRHPRQPREVRMSACRYCAAELPARQPGQRGPGRSTCDPCKREQARDRWRRQAERRRQERQERGPAPRRYAHQPGAAFGDLILVERLQEDALAVFACRCGAHKVLRWRNVLQGRTANCADRAAHPDPRQADVPSYSTAHHQVAAARGPAREHACVGCGERAHHWAYRHDSPDQLVQDGGKDDGRVYAVDPASFWPACRACHRHWDRTRSQAAPRHALSLAHVALGMAAGHTDTDDHQEDNR